MTNYTESATRGEIALTTRYAILTGALWAVGSSWSTAIRSVVLQLIPDDTHDIVVGEILAAFLTTIIAVGLSLVVGRKWCTDAPSAVPTESTISRSTTLRRGN